MRLIQALSITLAILLVRSIAASVAGPSIISTLPSQNTSPFSSRPIVLDQRRSLRVYKTVDGNSAERGLWSYAKALWWAETGASDGYVRKALKLTNLDEAAVKSNKYYAYYVDKTEWYKIIKWLQKDVSTFQVWKTLNLDKITESSQLHSVRNTDAFRVYSRYVKHFNNAVISKLDNGYQPDRVLVERGASDAEMSARALIMANAGIKDDYTQVLLGLTTQGRFIKLLKGAELTGHRDFQFFKLFVEAKTAAGKRAAKKG